MINVKNFSLLRRIPIFSNRYQIRFFATKRENFDTTQDISFNPNPENEDELVVEVPMNLQPLYSYGNINQLPLYENLSNLDKLKSFIPAHKTNIFLFSLYTYFSYGTALFQPSLLITLYIVNKFFLVNSRKQLEILSISLSHDGNSLIITNFYSNIKVALGDVKKSQNAIKLGNESYYELKNPLFKIPLYMGSGGKILNNNLLDNLLSGNYHKVKFEYK